MIDQTSLYEIDEVVEDGDFIGFTYSISEGMELYRYEYKLDCNLGVCIAWKETIDKGGSISTTTVSKSYGGDCVPESIRIQSDDGSLSRVQEFKLRSVNHETPEFSVFSFKGKLALPGF